MFANVLFNAGFAFAIAGLLVALIGYSLGGR